MAFWNWGFHFGGESLEFPIYKLFFGDLKTIQLVMASDLFNLCSERWPVAKVATEKKRRGRPTNKKPMAKNLLAAGTFP